MDFDLTDTEQALRDGLRAVLERHAGAARARHVAAGTGYDHELERAVREVGYFEMMRDPEVGALPATLMVTDVAAALGTISTGTLALVVPALGLDDLLGPVAVVRRETDAPVRFASSPGFVLVVDDDDVRVHEMQPGEPVESMWGFPFARLALGACVRVLPGQSAQALTWWHLSVAAELVGAVGAALELTVDHLGSRVQFGRPLGALQALQHRLATLRVRLEGSRWLTCRAAWAGAPAEDTLAAAAHAVAMGRSAVRELHQMSGAMGLTDEYDLRLWTTRVAALAMEIGGPPAARTALARARWG